VTGRAFAASPARLRGHRREHPPGSYAFVVPDETASVEGILLDGIDDDALARLDAYEDEGRLYVRRRALAEVDGVTMPCDVYVGAAIARRR
jgi:gamma-glutamylcyclotransferase (GGCT)/AIG2-like uncharacterized protein YtfP